MTIKTPHTGALCDYRLCYTGDPACASMGQSAVQTFHHLLHWRQHETFATYIGRPDEDVNGHLSSGAAGSENVGTFYVISAFVPATGVTQREIVIVARRWQRGYADGSEIWEWYDDAAGGVTETLMDTAAMASASVTDDTWGEAPTGSTSIWRVPVTPVASSTDDGFRLSKLTCTRVLPALVQFSASPSLPTLTTAQAYIRSSDCQIGQTLRGKNSTDDGTIGALVHRTNNTTSGLIQATRRALFNTPYILGCYQNNSTTDDLREDGDGNPYYYRIRPRNLDGGTATISCLPALCVTADEDASITLTSYSTIGGASVGTWTYTVPAGGVTAALVTASDGTPSTGLACPVGVGYVRVQARTNFGALGQTLYLHTVSLWEPLSGGR